LASRVQGGKLSISYFDGPIDKLKNLGCLTSEAGKHLVLTIKNRALSGPSDLDDFDNLAYLVDALPQSFTESELEVVRETFSQFIERYSTECDLSNPEELREEASRISKVGDLLNVDTDDAQDILREIAREIEKEEESQWDDDDDRRGSGSFDLCTDGELDSMFGTLK